MLELQAALNAITPFMGWRPYAVYDVDWEKKRMEELAAKTSGGTGALVAPLPQPALFRTDPCDNGRFERWQEPGVGDAGWQPLSVTAGWDAQSFHDPEGRPYRGVAWYRFDLDVPAACEGKDVVLFAPAVVNEAWVWVNGRYAGHRPYKMPWFRPQELELDVGALLKPGERNRIALRVLCNYDVWGGNGIYERPFLYARKKGA
jgi:hypothetical protein